MAEAVLDVCLELLLPAPGLLQCELVLSSVNVCQQFVALDLQLCPADLEVRLYDLDLVLALANLKLSLGLLQVLLNLLHLEQRVLECRYPLRVVQFEEQVAPIG